MKLFVLFPKEVAGLKCSIDTPVKEADVGEFFLHGGHLLVGDGGQGQAGGTDGQTQSTQNYFRTAGDAEVCNTTTCGFLDCLF